MRAFVVTGPVAGPGTVPIELATIPAPRPGSGELLVKMHAIGVGIHDSYFLPAGISYPFPIGIEGAGVVEHVGDSVTGYRPGDRITFVSAMQTKGGTWADYAVVDAESLIVPLPAELDFATAAAIPVAGNTALRALATLATPPTVTAQQQAQPQTPNGGSMFVAGGAGAVGTLAIQLARQHGWRVAASASERNHQYLRTLGVDCAVDYHASDWQSAVLAWAPGGVDAAIAVHPGTTSDALPVVADDGTVVTISGDQVPSVRGITIATVPHAADVRAGLATVAADVAAGRIHVEIERAYPFEEAAAALDRVRSRHVRGKLVLLVA